MLTQVLLSRIVLSSDFNFNEIALKDIGRLERNGWKWSPYLDMLNVMLAAKALKTQQYDKAIRYAEDANKSRSIILKKDDERIIIPVSYLMAALVKTKKYNECINKFKEIDKKWLESESPKVVGSVDRVYSAYAQALFATGKKREAMSYQELSLALIAGIFDNKYHEDITEEANLLRTMLADQGEWKSLRNLEERYKLKPLPKNPAEK